MPDEVISGPILPSGVGLQADVKYCVWQAESAQGRRKS